MKTVGLLLIVSIVITVIGGGLSLMGYNESLQATTSTSTYTSIATSTGVVTLTSTETRVVTTSSGGSVFNEITDLQGTGSNAGVRYCGYYDHWDVYLEAGQVHVSYNSVGSSVYFWLLDQKGWDAWERERTCEGVIATKGIAKSASKNYETTVGIPLSATYYVVFLNTNKQTATITVNIDSASLPTVVTVTEARTGYSTKTSTVTTEIKKPVSQPAGLGILFFSGIGLVTVAIIGIAVAAMKRRGGIVSAYATSAAAPPPPSPQGPQSKFCINCRASLPSQATYCNKCGSKQE